jgi:putative thioredoxin
VLERPRYFFDLRRPGEDNVTIIEQGGAATPQAAPDLIKETTTQTFVKDVIEE